ncbi:MAG: DEAD/DEAH box helicase [Leptospirales bacterium]
MVATDGKMGFNSLNLHSKLAARAETLGFKAPTPIQLAAIPVALKKTDIIGLAQTGTGKTAAFILPILQNIITSPRKPGIKALIIAPTRELAEQINEVAISFGGELKVRSVSIFGGVNINTQVKELRRGVDIVVACPGRLLDHINRKTINLSTVETLVLDEADQMLDMGFFPDIKKITGKLPRQRQTLLFSATMPSAIEKLTQSIQQNPVKIQVDRREPTTQVEHSMYPVQQHRKKDLLQYVIKKENSFSTLVFTRTKHRAKQLAQKLSKTGHKATSLHGNLSISQRRHAVEGFKKGKYHILVATDIAARGIDISGISHVINYDVPVTPETYIHRIGRTGRAAETGVAYTFASNEEMGAVSQIEKILKSKLPVNKHSFR